MKKTRKYLARVYEVSRDSKRLVDERTFDFIAWEVFLFAMQYLLDNDYLFTLEVYKK